MKTQTAFIGAGSRALSSHYPIVTNLELANLKAVSELDGSRLETVVTQYSIPNSYVDHRRMLEEIELDAVYVVMGETFVKDVALECMEAGKHVFIEKPPGANIEESKELLASATKNEVICMVGLQRRYSAVTREALRLTRANGPVTLAIGEFHKPKPSIDPMGNSTLWSDICHIVDWVTYRHTTPTSCIVGIQSPLNWNITRPHNRSCSCKALAPTPIRISRSMARKCGTWFDRHSWNARWFGGTERPRPGTSNYTSISS